MFRRMYSSTGFRSCVFRNPRIAIAACTLLTLAIIPGVAKGDYPYPIHAHAIVFAPDGTKDHQYILFTSAGQITASLGGRTATVAVSEHYFSFTGSNGYSFGGNANHYNVIQDLGGGYQGQWQINPTLPPTTPTPPPEPPNTNTLFVATTGNDNNTGTSRDQALRTIQAAVNKARAGYSILIAPGNYTPVEAIEINLPASTQTLTIALDTGSTETGSVTVSPKNGKWSFIVQGRTPVKIEGLKFLGLEDSCFGVLFRNYESHCNLTNCGFTGLYWALSSEAHTKTTIENCTFANCQNAVMLDLVNVTEIKDCTFTSNGYKIWAHRLTQLTVSNCIFDDSTVVSPQPFSNLVSGVVLSKCPNTLFENCKFRNVYDCLRLFFDSAITIRNTQFEQVRNTALSVRQFGDSSVPVDITLDGVSMVNTDRSAKGIVINHNAVKKLNLVNTTITGMSSGIEITEANSNFKLLATTSAIRNCDVAVRESLPLLTLNNQTQLSLTDNRVGLLSEQIGSTLTSVVLQGQTYTNNEIAVQCDRADVKATNCIFRDNHTGLQVTNGRRLVVRDCQFLNQAGTGVVGIDVDSTGVLIRNTSIDNCGTGIIAKSLVPSSTLQQLALTNNAVAGLVLEQSTWTMRPINSISIVASEVGVDCINSEITVENMTLANCGTAVRQLRGRLTVKNSTLGGSTAGLESLLANDLTLSHVTAANASVAGIRVQQAASVTATSVNTSSCRNGFVCQTDNATPTQLLMQHCRFLNNTERGLVLDRVRYESANIQNIEIHGGQVGLDFTHTLANIDDTANLTISGCGIAVNGSQSDLRFTNATLSGSVASVFCNNGTLEADNCDFGVVGNDASDSVVCQESSANLVRCEFGRSVLITNGTLVVDDCTFRGSQADVVSDNSNAQITRTKLEAGITFSTAGLPTHSLTIDDCELAISDSNSIGISCRGRSSHSPAVTIQNTRIDGGGFGIVGQNVNLAAEGVTVLNSKSYGVHMRNGGASTFDQLHVENSGSWGVLSMGDECTINSSKVLNSREGIATIARTTQLTNCIVDVEQNAFVCVNRSGRYNIFHSTIVAEKSLGIGSYGGILDVANSIVVAPAQAYGGNRGTGPFTSRNNLIHGPVSIAEEDLDQTNDIFRNPVFVDATQKDYRLSAGSPAINAGLDLGVVTDIDGNTRPSFGRVEIGAHEYTNASGSFRLLDWQERAN